ncbi:MAG: hypothetical protein IPJ88_07790 [Myxococcales bacterium]|nr:MAG: hypothetical protein IPJ88_07790 [Myxococcales bacterium]
MIRALLLCLVPILLTQCTVVNDLSRFQDACTGDINKTRDFEAVLSGLEAYSQSNLAFSRIELRIVNETHTIVSRAVVYGHNTELEGDTVEVYMPNAIPPGEHKVHLFIKDTLIPTDSSMTTDGQPSQRTPSWIRDMCPSGLFEFEADDAFQTLDDPPTTDVGNPFLMELRDLFPHSDGKQRLEMQISDDIEDLTRGYFRIAGFTNNTILVGVPGIAEANHRYKIEFYADKNQNGVYDGHPDDHSWSLIETAGPLGLFLIGDNAWVHDTNFAVVDF